MLPREGRLNLEKNLVNFRSIRFRIRTNVNFGRMESTATFYLIWEVSVCKYYFSTMKQVLPLNFAPENNGNLGWIERAPSFEFNLRRFGLIA